MKINCSEISINDDDLGCQITFSENRDLRKETENMSVKEIIDSTNRYLLLQRSYPEDKYGSNNFYFETHNENLCGDLIDYEMMLSRTYFEFKIRNEKIGILINPTEKEFGELKKALQILTNKKGKLTIND